jgi:hypothetical protein
LVDMPSRYGNGGIGDGAGALVAVVLYTKITMSSASEPSWIPAIHDGSGGDASAIKGSRVSTRTTGTRVKFPRLVEGDKPLNGVLMPRGREPEHISSLPMAERPREMFANLRPARPPPSRKIISTADTAPRN